MFKEAIIEELKKHVKGEIVLELPPGGMGDYAFPCFALAKQLKKSPAQIAEDIAGKIKIDFLEKVKAEGPYVNFFVKTDAIAGRTVPSVLVEKEKYGSRDVGNNQTVIIDYSHPNVGKPFHIGHLRSTLIGQSLYKLHEFLGFKVVRWNYIGDWGTQYGKLIYAYLTWGDEARLKKEGVKYIFELYVKFGAESKKKPELQEEARKWFKKLEEGDATATKLWKTFREYSLQEFNRIYDILSVKFDTWEGESFFTDKMIPIIDLAKKKGLAEEDEGALVIKVKDEIPFMLLKSDGATTYGLRDLALMRHRMDDYKADIMLYVVGAEQSMYFRQLFYVGKELLNPDLNLRHISFGFYLGKDGKKFATRKGEVVFLDDVLKSTIDKAKKLIEEKNPELKDKNEIARQVGVGAVFFGDLMNDRMKDCVFDWDKILDFEGDTGPYLQYTHARAASIIRKAKEQGLEPKTDFDARVLIESSEARLVRLLSRFGQKVEDALAQYKPHLIAQYCLELARTFNEFYHACPCISEKDEAKRIARLSLIEASRQVLQNSLGLLNIEAPFEM
jgi:arginyl-tRNA synthetase